MFQAKKTSKTGNQRTVEADTMEQNDLSSDDEEEDTSELSASSTKKEMSLDMYFKVHGINLEDEEDEKDEEDELDDAANDEGNGGQASNEGRIKKKTREKTMCKKLHATDFNDRREVEFFGGQPIGPTKEVVSNLNQLLDTTVRNSRFVTLLYTSWHGVPKNLKEDMLEYSNVCKYSIIDNFFLIYLLLYLC
ncbi:hypothetical protein Ahy_A07g034345 [Arachis hypogaea]|uniref:Uncharacterized protein n=1 Tax=Arachis hypogaea TaxID=3818 RepID=A0A445CBI5_ARAHY|nr:hypothetical protein Ahy_A07g034345 [Arachis hypogaea]